ncbi:MAG: hypothetical protein GF355_07860, partial [Candidatus Eisenbacteria bacterium]|nr:hypothetical protein [Candidatus Eisenbacteria bacterium]
MTKRTVWAFIGVIALVFPLLSVGCSDDDDDGGAGPQPQCTLSTTQLEFDPVQ